MSKGESRVGAGSHASLEIVRNDAGSPASRMGAVLHGMLAALGVILWGLGWGVHWLVLSGMLEALFHLFEAAHWRVDRDAALRQLFENYAGFFTVYMAYALVEIAGGVWAWLH